MKMQQIDVILAAIRHTNENVCHVVHIMLYMINDFFLDNFVNYVP